MATPRGASGAQTPVMGGQRLGTTTPVHMNGGLIITGIVYKTRKKDVSRIFTISTILSGLENVASFFSFPPHLCLLFSFTLSEDLGIGNNIS